MSSVSYNVPDTNRDKKTQSWLQKMSGLNLSWTFYILTEVPHGEIEVSTFTQQESLMEKPGPDTRQEQETHSAARPHPELPGLERRCEEMCGPRDAAGGVCSETQ